MERRRLVVGVDTNKGKSGKYKERHNCVVNQEINSVNSLPGGNTRVGQYKKLFIF